VGKESVREYVLGTHDAELERLALQHRLWRGVAIQCWDRSCIGTGAAVLDLGCGPGFATLDLASRVGPQGEVIALDESERFINHLNRSSLQGGFQNITARVADIQSPNLLSESVDVAYARWVLCFVPDPDAVVQEVTKALRPGGRFAVQDYVNYEAMLLSPPSEQFTRVVRVVAESWRRRGGDPNICQRIPSTMVHCGLTVERMRPIVRSARPDSPLWLWPESFFRNFLPLLVEQGLLTLEEQRAYDRLWAERTADPAAFFCSPPMMEIIARKPGAG